MAPGCHVAIVAALAVCPLSAPAQTQHIEFDDGVDASGGINWTFQRDSVAHDMYGDVVDDGIERFAPTSTLAGAPRNLTAFGPVGSVRPFTAGYAADGTTPVLVVLHGVDGTFDVHVGRDAAYNAYELDDGSNSYRFPYIDATEENEGNLLMGQTGLDGGTPAQPGYAFEPKGAQVYSGLIMVQCDVRRDHDNWGQTAYRTVKTALVWTTVERLQSAADPWIVAGVSGPVHDDTRVSGQTWTINAFPLGADEVAVCVSSYEVNNKRGGHTYVGVFSRERTWDLTACTLIHQHFAHEHFHCAGIIRHDDGRLSVLISVGDGIDVDRLLARTKPAGADWHEDEPWPWSGINGQYQMSLASSLWTPVATVWGGDDPDVPRSHNQFIDTIAADPDLSALICSADENVPVIKRLEYDPDTQSCTWSTLYMPTASSWPKERPVSLSLEGYPGGPYVARLGGQSWADDGFPESRVLYSPDGVRWSQCLAPYERAQSPVAIADERIWIGHIGNSNRIRRFDIPATRTGKPIELAGAGANLMLQDMPMPTGLGSGVQVDKLAGAGDLPKGVPAPPCDDGNIFLISGTQTSGAYGVWRPVGSTPMLPRPKKSVMVRYWIHAPGPNGETFLERASLSLWGRVMATDGSENDIKTGLISTDPGVWVPITIWFTPEMFGDELADPWSFLVQLFAYSFSPQPAPSEFLIAWDGVYLDRDTIDGHGAPPGADGAAEVGRASNWSLGETYTIVGYGSLPMNAWDNRMGGGPSHNAHEHTLVRFIDDDSGETMDVRAIPGVRGFALAASVDNGAVKSVLGDSVFWLRESPVLFALICDGTKTELHLSVGGTPIRKIAIDDLALAFDTIELGHTPMRWHAIQGVPQALPSGTVYDTLRELGDLTTCEADLNGDGQLNILDFVTFQTAFVAQDPLADCDQSGTFNVLDFICYQLKFVAGCP